MKYYEIQLVLKEDAAISDDVANRSVACLLLPRLTPDNEQTYCIVYSDWRIN